MFIQNPFTDTEKLKVLDLSPVTSGIFKNN